MTFLKTLVLRRPEIWLRSDCNFFPQKREGLKYHEQVSFLLEIKNYVSKTAGKRNAILQMPKAHSQPSQTFKMELFSKE